ncbi:MutS-related protein [Janthinobacterium aquaticum]|uniref:MutS-related protein n=1 Tax=Janthinobacterium sp. FT58W TaxID=2654254 RepID=UPI00186ADAB2|nr:DNA mismatch repair protein MutS [Janthinobacterium sp. FT58W]
MFSFLLRLFPASAPLLAPVVDYPFSRTDVAMLQQLAGTAPQIDAQTWHDLLLDPYSERLAQQTSIFGQQELHRRLQGGRATPESIERVDALLADAPLAAGLTQACHGLRRADAEASTSLFGAPFASRPWWSGWLWLIALALLLSIGATWLVGPLALTGVLACCVVLMTVQSRFYETCKQWEYQLDTLRHLLKAYAALGRLDVPMTAPFRAGRAQAGKLVRGIELSLLRYLPLIDTIMVEYGDWLLLKNVTRYFRTRELVAAQLGFLRQAYLEVAALEADLALVRHLRAQPAFCHAKEGAPRELDLQDMVHPLLSQAAPLSLNLAQRGAFISGQNGIGKSTLLRTLGLNLVCARAFGFCHARSATLPRGPVYSSMQSEDSLAGGESLYLAELRRARELLALAQGDHDALFIIDEIFRGTNHLESISAAAAVLHQLAARHLVIVSSHNLVLAPLLEAWLAPWCVQRDNAGSLTLAPGVLAATNGIALLAERGFGRQIEDSAGRVFDWLSTHMAQPTNCSGVLVGSVSAAA